MALKKLIQSALLATTLALSSTASADEGSALNIGVVDFRSCLEKSYLGQQEQLKLESMRNEMVSTLEGKEKALAEVMDKLKKPEYLDTLSPQAEEELQQEYAKLSEEMQILQNQAYQALNQAQMKMFQSISEEVSKSAEYIAREHNVDMIVNQEGCFYHKRPLDFTQLIISDLNRQFQPESATAQAEDNQKEAL